MLYTCVYVCARVRGSKTPPKGRVSPRDLPTGCLNDNIWKVGQPAGLLTWSEFNWIHAKPPRN